MEKGKAATVFLYLAAGAGAIMLVEGILKVIDKTGEPAFCFAGALALLAFGLGGSTLLKSLPLAAAHGEREDPPEEG